MVHTGCIPAPHSSFPKHNQEPQGSSEQPPGLGKSSKTSLVTKPSSARVARAGVTVLIIVWLWLKKWLVKGDSHSNALILLIAEGDQTPCHTWDLQSGAETRLLSEPAKQFLLFLQKTTALGWAGGKSWDSSLAMTEEQVHPLKFCFSWSPKILLCCFTFRVSHLSV